MQRGYSCIQDICLISCIQDGYPNILYTRTRTGNLTWCQWLAGVYNETFCAEKVSECGHTWTLYTSDHGHQNKPAQHLQHWVFWAKMGSQRWQKKGQSTKAMCCNWVCWNHSKLINVFLMILVGHNSLHWVKNWSGQLKLLKTLFDSGASCKSEQKISSCNRFEVLEISFNSFLLKMQPG